MSAGVAAPLRALGLIAAAAALALAFAAYRSPVMGLMLDGLPLCG